MGTAKRQIIYREPELEIKTDASTNGWEANCNGNTLGGKWLKVEVQNHINSLELLADFFALRSLYKTARNNHISIKLDYHHCSVLHECSGWNCMKIMQIV